MKKKLSVFLFMLVVCIGISYAQSSRFHVGGVFPTGDFGDDSDGNSKSGHAGIGVNIGYKHYGSLPVQNLSLIVGVDLFYNGISGDTKDEMKEDYPNYNITFPNYLNVPFSAGINYTYPFENTNMAIYGEFGMGPNLSIETVQKFKSKKTDYQQKITYDPSVKISYNFEAGVEFKKKYIIGLRYNHLGTYKYKYTLIDKPEGDKEKGRMNKKPITNITLIAGLRF